MPFRIRLKMLWREGVMRGPLLRLAGGLGLLVGGLLVFALLRGEAACCGVGLGGLAALAGVMLLSIGLYETAAVLLWSD